jgi:hypothetical protein
VGFLSKRVTEIALDRHPLFDAWYALPPNRALRVVRIAEREIIGRDRDREPCGHRARGPDALGVGQSEGFVETL